MKIAIIRHSIRKRGSDRIIFDYANYLINKGYSITYYTNDIQTDFAYNRSIDFKQIPIKGKLGTLLFALSNRFKEDIVLIDLVATACLAWILNRKKLIYYAQDFDVSYYSSISIRTFIHLCYTLALKFLKIPVIAASEGLSLKLIRYKPSRLIIAPNYVDLNLFYFNEKSEYFKDKDSSKIILLFARNDYRKGLDIAIKALEELCQISQHQGWKVWTIGDELKPIKDIKITNYGFLDIEGLRDILSAADIYLLPSRSEGLSTLLLQALACECAVVGTEAARVITNEADGLISPIEDYKTLSENMNHLLQDNGLRDKLKRNARTLAEKYSLEESCKKFESALKELISKA